MKISINAGHTLKGVGSGAIGFLNESEETRRITNKVITALKSNGHTVYNHTVDEASTVLKSLQGIVNKVNSSDAELFISIHFNASNGKGKGSEIYTYNGVKNSIAEQILNNLKKLGFVNRGIKNGSHLHVVKNTNPTALLIEVCFIDNEEDVELYANNIDNIVEAIVSGITGNTTESYVTEFEEAKNKMIALGVTDGSRPKDNVTREELWTMLHRLYKK